MDGKIIDMPCHPSATYTSCFENRQKKKERASSLCWIRGASVHPCHAGGKQREKEERRIIKKR